MIYAIRAGDCGPVKFGVARDPRSRLSTLQTGSPVELKLLASAPVHESNEKLIHRYLRGQRERGEWFRPDEKTLEVVDVLKRQAESDEHVLMEHIWQRDLRAVIWFRRHIGADFDVFESEVERALAEGIENCSIAPNPPEVTG